MNQKRNKFLVEAMGMCRPPCFKKCRKVHSNMDFSTWPGFGILWEWALVQDWWEKFTDENYHCCRTDLDMINPRKFANMVYNYLKEKKRCSYQKVKKEVWK